MIPFISHHNTVGPLRHGYADDATMLVRMASEERAEMVGICLDEGVEVCSRFVLSCKEKDILPTIGFALRMDKGIAYAYPLTLNAWRRMIKAASEGLPLSSVDDFTAEVAILTGGPLSPLQHLLNSPHGESKAESVLDALLDKFNHVFIEVSNNKLGAIYDEDNLNNWLINQAQKRGLPWLISANGRYYDSLGQSLDHLLLAAERPGGAFSSTDVVRIYEAGDFFYENRASRLAKWGEERVRAGLDGQNALRDLLKPMAHMLLSIYSKRASVRKAILPPWANSMYAENHKLISALVQACIPESKDWTSEDKLLSFITLIGLEVNYKIPIFRNYFFTEKKLDNKFVKVCLRILQMGQQEGDQIYRWRRALFDRMTPQSPHPREDVKDRIIDELRAFVRHRECGRLLAVLDAKVRCARMGIPWHLRGSASASAVLRALGIAHHDPIGYNLSFSRFLSDAREKPPDIDFEVAASGRQNLLDELWHQRAGTSLQVQRRWGQQAAYRALATAIGRDGKIAPALRQQLAPHIEKLANSCRGYTTSPSAIVFPPPFLSSAIPSLEGGRTLCLTHEQAATLEIARLDVLSSRWLDFIRSIYEALKSLNIDPSCNIDEGLEAGLRLIRQGYTYGLFQMDTGKQAREIAMAVSPKNVAELMHCLALNRPGAQRQLEVYTGRTAPVLSIEWLADTKGALIYQEQITDIATKVLGMPMGDAERARSAICKGKLDDEHAQRFFDRLAQVIGKKKMDQLRDVLADEGGYLFNRAHAASYAQLVLEGASLKARYPALFIYHVWKARGFARPDILRGMEEALRIGVKFVHVKGYIPENPEILTKANGDTSIILGKINITSVIQGGGDALSTQSPLYHALKAFADGDTRPLLGLASQTCRHRHRWFIHLLDRLELLHGQNNGHALS